MSSGAGRWAAGRFDYVVVAQPVFVMADEAVARARAWTASDPAATLAGASGRAVVFRLSGGSTPAGCPR